jgi:15-cis-phytoene synthase
MIAIDHRLALAYGPARLRKDLAVLLSFDAQMANAFRLSATPALVQIRLAWWRDQLGRSDVRDPLLIDINRLIASYPPLKAALERMIEGWSVLLDDPPYDEAQLRAFAHDRGGGLFAAAGGIAGEPIDETLGQGWALVDLARHCSDKTTASLAMALASDRFATIRWKAQPSKLRSMAIIAYFASRDSIQKIHIKYRDGSPVRLYQVICYFLSR